MKKILALSLFILVALQLRAISHADDFNVLQRKKGVVHGNLVGKGRVSGCSYCHSSMGGYNGLNEMEEWTCLICHSSKDPLSVEGKVNPSRRKNIQKNLAATDILTELKKPYSHPVLSVSGVHVNGESLPEQNTKAQRHAECFDCHDSHSLSSWNKIGPIKTIGALGERKKNKALKDMRRDEVLPDYELCFNCHADSANLPLTETNKRAEFSVNNPSYHPVIAEGKNGAVPSLKPPYSVQKRGEAISIISCGDCHGNDDDKGPNGPHGSIYPHILTRNYNIADGQQESSFQYALCYNCHDRGSILRNDSFRYHAIHIQGNINKGGIGTSCYTCHNSHGSIDNKFLIKFNRDVVFPNISSGQLRFVSTGTFSGECYLSCHGVNHNPKRY